jgi:hypothetical protein
MVERSMTSRQRVEAVIAGRPVDRVPTFILSISCQVASQLLGRPAYTGTGELHYYEVRAWAQGEQAHDEFERQLEQDVLAIHRHLDVDVLHPPWRMNRRPTKQLDEHTFLFGDLADCYEVWRYAPASGDFACIETGGPAIEPEQALLEQVEQLEMRAAAGDATVKAAAARFGEQQRRYGEQFAFIGGGAGISVGHDPNSLMALALSPDLMARKTMAQARLGIALGTALREAGGFPVLFGGGDLAGAAGPIYSPAAFAQVVLPAYQRLLAHLNTLGVHYVFRSDGNIWPLADMLFRQAACPGFGEVDRDAGMTMAALRQRYPELVVWGNVSSSLLASATVRQVRGESRRVIDEAAGRGYVHGCSNAIVIGTPPTNVEAMFSVR